MKTPLTVCWTVQLDEVQRLRLFEKAKAEGWDKNPTDAGPLVAIQRMLLDTGLAGSFQGNDMNGLEFAMHYECKEGKPL